MYLLDNNKIITPMYSFSRKNLVECYSKICNKMNGVSIFYALKANAEKEILLILKDIGAGFEIASIGEFNILKDIGVDSSRIICGLPIKPIDWLKHMYSMGCMYFVFDSVAELNKLNKYAPLSRKILRINISDITIDSIDYGLSLEGVESVLSSNSEHVNSVDGLSFHITNNVDISCFNSVMDRVESILPLLSKREIVLNIGGGYRLSASDDFFENLNLRIRKIEREYKVVVIAEPGNTIVNSAGKIYTTVVGLKSREDYIDVFIDAGKPSGIKTNNKRIPSSIKVIGKKLCNKRFTYRFIDITCMHKPHFIETFNCAIAVGDIIEFSDMGAYSICLQNKFHLWEPPNIKITE